MYDLKKVDFVWINRDYESFEWFIELLGKLELQQKSKSKEERFVDFHLYMTSAENEQEIRPSGFVEKQSGQMGCHINENECVLKINAGRPNFAKVIQTKIQIYRQ